MSEKNGSFNTSQCRQPIFILNVVTLISLMVVIALLAIYLYEGREQAKTTANQSIENGKAINQVNQTVIKAIDKVNHTVTYTNESFFAFLDNYYERQAIGNERANATLEGFNNLTKYIQEVLEIQLSNEENIIGNLTDHRIIQNLTRDQNEEEHQAMMGILNKTG